MRAIPTDEIWLTDSLYFNLNYYGGHRYLDNCGEFMVRAQEQLGFVAKEARPTGATMNQPETAATIELNSGSLSMSFPCFELDWDYFKTTSNEVAKIADELVNPVGVDSRGCCANLYRKVQSEQDAYDLSLKIGGLGEWKPMADALGLSFLQQSRMMSFVSGSYDLRVEIKPVAFSVPNKRTSNYGFRPTDKRREIVDKSNELALKERALHGAGYAVLLEIDLIEQTPDRLDFSSQVDALKKHVAVVTQLGIFS